jgi:hypothetical protein
MLVFTYLGLLWGLVCFDLPADASSIYARSMVSNCGSSVAQNLHVPSAPNHEVRTMHDEQLPMCLK